MTVRNGAKTILRRARNEAKERDDRKRYMMFEYVSRYGPKITYRKCCFDPDSLCDMLCFDFKIKIISQETSRGQVFHAECFCAKFEPPAELETLKIHPLDKEEDEG